MQWHSVSQFLAMGGYGFYVWGSFGVTALCLVAEIWLIRRRRLATLESVKSELQESPSP